MSGKFISDPRLALHAKELCATSYDDDNGEYLIGSNLYGICFDDVKKSYMEELVDQPNGMPSSCDALYETTDGKLVLIEFKNEKIRGNKQYALHRKARDSILILCDILNLHISDTRLMLYLIIVGAQEKNPSLIKIRNHEQRKAKKGPIYDLDLFRNYCVKDVIACNQNDFDALFSSPISSNDLLTLV